MIPGFLTSLGVRAKVVGDAARAAARQETSSLLWRERTC